MVILFIVKYTVQWLGLGKLRKFSQINKEEASLFGPW